MALPNSTDLKTLDYAYQGTPFVYIAAKNDIVLKDMEYTYLGAPFVANPADSEQPPEEPVNTTAFFAFF